MKLRHFSIIAIASLLILITACQSTQPTVPLAPLPETIALRIRLVTTSDWTDLFLVSGATWLKHDPVSVAEAATTAEIQPAHLILNQPILRAQAGQSVEIVADVLLSTLPGEKPVTFRIERGDIGNTLVEFSRDLGDKWLVFKTVNWEGISGDGINPHIIALNPEELTAEITSPVAAQPQPGTLTVTPLAEMPSGTDGYPWWNDTVFYEIFVRSFFDSNGDGIGDLNGITQKLDYLNDGDPQTTSDLGVTGLWLMPVYPSPSYHGYNVTDFYTINPEYGTLADFKTLLAAAHARGIRIILDITLNHTSTQHPRFIQAADPASPDHDWYIWRDADPGYTGSWGQQVWFPYNDLYFYSTFSANFADLNFDNPAVQAEMQNVVRFWLQDVGVDGFRLDAAKHIIEEGQNQANTPSTHAFWKGFRRFYKQIDPQAITVGEIWDKPALNAAYLQGDEFDLAFDFYLADSFIKADNQGSSSALIAQLELSNSLVPAGQFASFLTNHDQDRLLSQLGNDLQKARVAASLLLTAPGVPFMYYGEEIGMQAQKPDEQIRSPMQWSPERFGGFSTVYPWQPLAPAWQSVNVESETGDPDSLLSYYRRLIEIRRQHPALRVGELSLLNTGNKALYSILRLSQQEAVLVLINLTGKPLSNYALSLKQSGLAAGSLQPTPILGKGEIAPLTINSTGGFSRYLPLPEIPPFETLILQLPLNSP